MATDGSQQQNAYELQPLQGDRRPGNVYSVSEYPKNHKRTQKTTNRAFKFLSGETRRPLGQRQQHRTPGHTCCCTCFAEDEEEDDGEEYEYSCCPPRVFMLLISFAQIGMFAYYLISGKQDNLQDSPLIYRYDRRNESWRFVSYSLLHAGYDHIIGNMVFQLILGVSLELIFCWQVVVIYLCGVVSGCLAHSVLQGTTMLVGASGGAYCLVTAHVAKIIMNISEMKKRHDLLPIFGGIFWFGLALIFLAEQMISAYVYKTQGVSYSCHLGGALCGFFLGCPILNLNLDRGWEKWFSAICYIIFILLVGGAIIFNIFYDYNSVSSGT